MEPLDRQPHLLVRAAGQLCAVPLAPISEVLRMPAIRPIAGAPATVRGLAILRGAPTPVIDLGILLGGAPASERLVALRLGARAAAVSVDAVIGVRMLDGWLVQDLPALVRNLEGDLIERIAVADAELLLLLQTACLVPEAVWQIVGESSAVA